MKTNPSSVIYTPLDVSTLGQKYLAYKRDNKDFGVTFPVPKVSNRVYPLFPGEVMSLIARPGHAKTGLMMMWARSRAKFLKETHKNRVVIYATWEQSIEELHSFYVASEQHLSITKMAKGELSEGDWEKSMQASTSRIDEPMWFVGHSMMRKTGRQPITVDVLAEALEQVAKWNSADLEVDCVYVDYLQRIHPTRSFDNPVIAYSGIMDDLKNLALGFGVPIVVGVQASREVENLKLQIPEMHHAQWTSNIEQSSDRVLSLVRPRRYRKEGESFGSTTVSGNNQLLINVLKQKLGEANFAEWVKFNPVYNKLDEAETVNPVPDAWRNNELQENYQN